MDYINDFYNATATHDYVFGVLRNGRVKAYFVTLDLDGYRIVFSEKPTMAQRQTVVKYRSNRAKIAYFETIATRVIDLMTVEELKAACRVKINRYGKPYTENCGECFEWLIAKFTNGTQNDKSNLKHTDGGDLVIDGKAWQVKYEKGAITVRV